MKNVAPSFIAGKSYRGRYDCPKLDVNSLFKPQCATVGPRYLITGPTSPFIKLNINELILLGIWIKNSREIKKKSTSQYISR